MAHLLQVLGIIFGALQSLAGAFAVAQVILQAYLEFALGYIGGSQLQVATTECDIVLHQLQQLFYPAQPGKGAEVFRAIADNAAGKEYTGEVFVLNDDVGVGLIVLELYIEAGLVMLDEGIFQQKGIVLRICDRKIYGVDEGNKAAGLVVVYRFIEVRADALAQVFGLAHV